MRVVGDLVSVVPRRIIRERLVTQGQRRLDRTGFLIWPHALKKQKRKGKR